MSTSSSPTSGSRKPTSPPPSPAEALRRAYRQGWTPPPRISVPEWADRYRRLAKEAGSTSGKWNTATVEVARGPMLAVTEPGVRTISVMCCTQLMKTALLENVFGFHAHLDPCPMLLLQPKDEAAKQFSKERITPLIRSTPVLRALVGSGRSRNGDDTLLYLAVPGGFLALAGAGSPDNVARRPVRIVMADEIDKYLPIREGDVLVLADERTATFALNSLSIRACSPTVKNESKIERSYESSDQRRASVACPHCAHRQFLDFFKHVQWDKDGATHKPATAAIYCESCGAAWSEGQRLRALATIRWHQTRPFASGGRHHVPLDDYERAWRAGHPDPIGLVWDWWEGPRHAVYRARCQATGAWPLENEHAGFQAGKLYSPWAKDTPARIARKWLDAQGDEDAILSWWNTQMGLAHRPASGKEPEVNALLARVEVWDAEVPDGVAVITVGVDFQGDRAELETVGWGRNEESWSLDHTVIEGDVEQPEFWERIDTCLRRIWRRSDSRSFAVGAACLDSGHHTQHVYAFARERLGRRIWAIKGESARFGQRSPVWPTKRPSARNKAGFRPVIIGTNAAKDVIRNRLLLPEAGPGYMHFPADRDLGFFQQLTAERIVIKRQGGQAFRIWDLPGGRANEALDIRVYAYAALQGLLHMGLRLNRLADDVAAPAVDEPVQAPPDPARSSGTDPARGPRDPIALPPAAVPAAPARSEPAVTIHHKPSRGRRMA